MGYAKPSTNRTTQRRITRASSLVPEGRHNVAHCGSGGGRWRDQEEPRRGDTMVTVSPLRGSLFKSNFNPPLPRWATMCRPSGTSEHAACCLRSSLLNLGKLQIQIAVRTRAILFFSAKVF